MSGGATTDWRTARRATARSDILRAAWGLARENGLAGLSLRDLAAQLGMRAPSLYSYFPSKDAIYDAMFAQGYREFLDLDRRPGADLAGELRLRTQDFVRFCLDNPVRYQLLFQRTIPGFQPSAESWELAQQAYATSLSGLIGFGVTPRGLDMITAVLTGLVDQQISNDPGGERWAGLADEAADMLLAHLTPKRLARIQLNDSPIRRRRT